MCEHLFFFFRGSFFFFLFRFLCGFFCFVFFQPESARLSNNCHQSQRTRVERGEKVTMYYVERERERIDRGKKKLKKNPATEDGGREAPTRSQIAANNANNSDSQERERWTERKEE